MIEVPPARIPEKPGAVIPHAGICEGGLGQSTSLPSSGKKMETFTHRSLGGKIDF